MCGYHFVFVIENDPIDGSRGTLMRCNSFSSFSISIVWSATKRKYRIRNSKWNELIPNCMILYFNCFRFVRTSLIYYIYCVYFGIECKPRCAGVFLFINLIRLFHNNLIAEREMRIFSLIHSLLFFGHYQDPNAHLHTQTYTK